MKGRSFIPLIGLVLIAGCGSGKKFSGPMERKEQFDISPALRMEFLSIHATERTHCLATLARLLGRLSLHIRVEALVAVLDEEFELEVGTHCKITERKRL